jgi:hypothetical protein
MATNLALDDNLIAQAQKVGHHKTKKDAVTTAQKPEEPLIKKPAFSGGVFAVEKGIISVVLITHNEDFNSSVLGFSCCGFI